MGQDKQLNIASREGHKRSPASPTSSRRRALRLSRDCSPTSGAFLVKRVTLSPAITGTAPTPANDPPFAPFAPVAPFPFSGQASEVKRHAPT
jgi:hypothetical protein